MKRQILTALSAVALAAVANVASAADIPAGKAKSASCAGCHGANGISAVPTYPNLAGQKEAYLVKQMKAFRDGTRTDPTMNAMASPGRAECATASPTSERPLSTANEPITPEASPREAVPISTTSVLYGTSVASANN